MRIRCLQHVPFEGPGLIESWALRRGHTIAGTRLDLGERLPELSSFDLLLCMGGPMSVNDEQRFAWLRPEKRLIADAIGADKIVVGICLGAQLIASAAGSRVAAGNKEIGWYPVRKCSPAAGSGPLSAAPREFMALHWHGETFELPTGAVRLAETDGCPNQAFQLGPRVLGLQFHLEIGIDGVQALLTHASEDLTEGEWVQSSEEIVGGTLQFGAAASGHLDCVLDAISAG